MVVLYYPYFLTDMGKIYYRSPQNAVHERFTHNTVEHMRILLKFTQEGMCFSYEHKWTQIYTWSMKEYDIFKVKKSLIKSVYMVGQ